MYEIVRKSRILDGPFVTASFGMVSGWVVYSLYFFSLLRREEVERKRLPG